MKAIVSVFDEKTYTCKDTIIDTQGTHPMTDKELFARLYILEEEMFFIINKLRDRIVELIKTEQKYKELCK